MCLREFIVDKPIVIFSDSKSVLKALDSFVYYSALLLHCIKCLNNMALVVPIKLVWVPGHCDVLGNTWLNLEHPTNLLDLILVCP